VITEIVTTPGWTNVVASGEYLLFYNYSTGAYQTYAMATNSHIAKVSIPAHRSGRVGPADVA
jgi:hypothetical protein